MKNRGNTLVSVLVSMVLILLLTVGFFYGSGMFKSPGSQQSARPDGLGKTIPGAAQMAARDEVCRSNIGQVRQSLMIMANGEETHPDNLMDLKLGESFTKCPIGHEPYNYDPATGTVSCPHPGHEKY